MTDKPRIAMSPSELPSQRLHEVVELPRRPEGVEIVPCMGWDPEGVLPKRRPRNMTYLGSVEWAWSPGHGRIDAYHLHRGRNHWILYIQDLDPEMPEYAWNVGAFVQRKGVDERLAAVHLLMERWKAENAEWDLDEFGWINAEGFLSVAELKEIARRVWST